MEANGFGRGPFSFRVARSRRGTSAAGFSLPEMLVVLAIASLVLMVTITYAVAWLGRAESRNAVYAMEGFMQRARMESVARSRACRFTLDSSTGVMNVYDLVDVSNTGDDILLASTTLSTKVSFARPDGGSAVTLGAISGSTYGATFAADGSVSAGSGLVALLGGDGYFRVDLYGAGGASVTRWDGAAWIVP